MKVGTITFHWATNYGAVLQSFALQKFLKDNGVETEIIQYLPQQNILFQKISWILKRKFMNFKKEKKIHKFRKQYLKVSEKNYYSNKGLCEITDEYDAIICGSDQVWNFSFLEYAEHNKITLSYFLNFAKSEIQRIAYATSFGTDQIPEKFIKIVKEELTKFKQIGVREQSAFDILNRIDVKSQVVLDPTLLLYREKYDELLAGKQQAKKFDFFSFVLHENQHFAEQCKQYIVCSKKEWKSIYNDEILTVEEWLFNEKNAHMILTNSFHSTVFAILFHTPFIVVPVEGSNMDDRIKTLLSIVGLEEHFLTRYDEEIIEQLMQVKINWDKVDEKLECERINSQQFLKNSLGLR